MPRVIVSQQTIEVPTGTKLAIAIEQLGVHIGHRCGGNARCTTCRVEFESSEPATMTEAEYDKLQERGLFGKARLSCQIAVDHDMAVRPLVTLETEPSWTDTGPALQNGVTPLAAWFPVSELKATKENE
ncbi:MAG: (2Fe-2S)-binding protein [Chloroflexi bacterium]|nr:(2Fe-2S)-binding protein [Chloroflexota bacterium]